MEKTLEQYLLDAVGKSKDELSVENPYREFGFDGDKQRLGWMKITQFSRIKETLRKLTGILEGKDCFVFVGIGGSGNGIKALLSLFKGVPLYTLDSLDPAALKELKPKIKNTERTLVVSISKSGTTQETQLISRTLRELLGQNRQKNFLWLADPGAFEKLDALGWQGVAKVPIQFDAESDIGGRFSCPHTLIFFLPLFLLLNRDYGKLATIYSAYCSFVPALCRQAEALAKQVSILPRAFFAPYVDKIFGTSFSAWIVQLFQESLGSKRNGLAVKTLCGSGNAAKGFLAVKPELTASEPVVKLMLSMYFFQAFVAFYAAIKKLNFVNQEFVEKYKQAMRELEGKKETVLTVLTLAQVIAQAKNKILKKHTFIEIVLFFHPSRKIITTVEKEFAKTFKDKKILVFVGSDWNHHSYQAAFADKNTFFVLLTASRYATAIKPFPISVLEKNVATLKTISRATYLTLKDKSLLCALSK
ncbi:MAG: hypothetical protein PHV55_03240 [Candidatus Omnitrophica bacterium]|nr:hypothetical protein [Candidatus Omnitrophota bacterium]